jgi:hypothetical protein
MKSFILILSISFLVVRANAQTPLTKSSADKTSDSLFIVETACGECKFKMKGTSCDLAVRINGVAYFVDGTKIDDHGNAHASDGFCNTIRKASVSGSIVNNRFMATSFTLLPEEKPKQ